MALRLLDWQAGVKSVLSFAPSATTSASAPAPASPSGEIAILSPSSVFGADTFQASPQSALASVRQDAQALLDKAKPAPAPAPAKPSLGDAPYINQYKPEGAAQGYTNGPSNCGPTSMAMVARAFGWGKDLSDAKLINTLGAAGGTTGDGTGVQGIAQMAKKIGQPAEVHGPHADTDWIAKQLKAGKLVVANGDYFALPPHDASRIGQGGHYLLVVGMDDQGRFILNDPADASINHKAFTAGQLAHFINGNTNGGWQIAIG
ncbi:MAG TPA: C39 family peptidase [Oscillatoriaceae cyanobacterium]